MIKLNSNGYVNSIGHKKIIAAANHFIGLLLSKTVAKNTEVVISLKKLPKEFNGFCQINDKEPNPYNPKSFLIEINGLINIVDMIKTLSHEFVHLRQFRTKELGYRDSYTTFRGVAYRANLPYRQHPWEKEAYKLEKSLLKSYLKTVV
tara:strand:- start:1001 stop:1444 length:444 start_codon:yes stop_codon:yes gene_type:complete